MGSVEDYNIDSGQKLVTNGQDDLNEIWIVQEHHLDRATQYV